MSKELEVFDEIIELLKHYIKKGEVLKEEIFDQIDMVDGYPIENIRKALKDFEWLKSIIPIDAMFMWNLSSDDKLRLLKIMGVNYE